MCDNQDRCALLKAKQQQRLPTFCKQTQQYEEEPMQLFRKWGSNSIVAGYMVFR